MMIPVELIDDAPVTSPTKVRDYRALLKAGHVAPPILVARRGDRFTVRDGAHRLAAAKAEGVGEIDCLSIHSSPRGRSNLNLSELLRLRRSSLID